MFCRRAWQRIGPLALWSLKAPCKNAPVRHMSFGVPGGSTNMAYFILCGGGLTAAVVYAYKTVSGDSERYEDRPANIEPTAKAPAADTTPVEEAEPAAEVVTESVLAPEEPVAETTAELVIEVVAEDAATVASEVVVTEAEAEPAVTEEAAPPVYVEAVAEDAPVTMGLGATVETLAAESAESRPDLLTAVKILTGSTVEIAAASVNEKRLVNAVQQIEGDGRGLDSTMELPQPEIWEATIELVAKEAVVEVKEEELKSAEVGAVEEAADAEDAEEVTEEETFAPTAAAEKEEAAESSAATVKEVREVEAEYQVQDPEAAPEQTHSSADITVDETSLGNITPAAGTSAEGTGETASTLGEAAAVVNTSQLAAASTVSHLEVHSAAKPESEAPEHEAKHCHSCHSTPPAAEEVVPPAAGGGKLLSEGWNA